MHFVLIFSREVVSVILVLLYVNRVLSRLTVCASMPNGVNHDRFVCGSFVLTHQSVLWKKFSAQHSLSLCLLASFGVLSLSYLFVDFVVWFCRRRRQWTLFCSVFNVISYRFLPIAAIWVQHSRDSILCDSVHGECDLIVAAHILYLLNAFFRS